MEQVDWPQHLASWKWKQGEHVTLIGPTGCGKTTVARAILDRRQHVAVVATKPRDPVVSSLRRRGYDTIRKWPPSVLQSRVVFWPRIERMTDVHAQAVAIDAMLNDVYLAGSWCLYFDELRYVTETLKLKGLLELLWQQARALNVSIVAGAQRPAHIPLMAYSQATHFYLWNTGDDRDLARVADFGRAPARMIRDELATLDRHEVLYLDAVTGTAYVTEADPEG
jgi:DNA polymerase III delta prime subunit